MKKILGGLIVLMLSLPSIAHADGVIIPASIKVNEFKKEMKILGMDLYGNDESDGEIINNGTSIKVVTYKPISIEQLELLKETAFKTSRR